MRHDLCTKAGAGLVTQVVATSLLLTSLCLPARAEEKTAPAKVDTLVVVNGEAITTADLDAQIMAAHRGGGMDEMTVGRLQRLFDKAINDRLMIQEAEAIGLGEERQVRVPLQQWRHDRARAAYLRDAFTPEIEVGEAEIRDYFERYYWKVQLRQLSVRTEQRADSMRTAILDGADMAELAREHSVDVHSLRGGAHNLKYWADVEVVIRDAAQDLAVGEISQPFPYRESFALIRVEERQPVDWDALPRHEQDIASYLTMEKRKEASRAFVDELAREHPVSIDEAIMAEISADSAVVIKGEFLEGSERVVLRCGDFSKDELQVRKAISSAAMTDGLAAFATVREGALENLREELVVLAAAAEAGYLDDPELAEAYRERREKKLIEAYLAEFIAPEIVFTREAYEAVYEDYKDRFRGPDEVRLDTIVFTDEQTADAVVFRLREGADFGFVAERYGDDPHVSVSRGSWAKAAVFSIPIQEQISGMEIGDTSDPVQIPTGWLVFQLAGRRPGEVMPIEAVDTEIRQVLYQRTFNELLDEHLTLLKERSEIERNETAIREYFGKGF